MRYRITRRQKFTIDHGASAVEYGLLIGTIAAVIIGLVFALGDMIGPTFQQTQDCLVAFHDEPACNTATTGEP
jgi:Flp pilus assembly pilin Flp